MEFSEKQKELIEFVKQSHGDQKRKYTGDPYVTHLLNVCSRVIHLGSPFVEVALCHDLYEDTKVNFDSLYKRLIEIGYDLPESYNICTYTQELTDKFTKEDYPHLNRARRKSLESKRLSTVSFVSQTVKYADLLDNSYSILAHDSKFAETYMTEKKQIISLMRAGDRILMKQCDDLLHAYNDRTTL
jgi:(p)ppGpp synthase/HD superfamily hydrolase